MASDSSDLIHPLQGTLLLAAPQLRDPNFARSVLFLAAHSKQEGSFGYILNRPLDKVVSDLLDDTGLGSLADIRVFLGGPVSTDKLSFASLEWNEAHRTMVSKTHLSLSDALYELKLGNEVRGFVGYSGWSSGQLERELKQSSWIVTNPAKIALEVDRPAELWTDILMKMGPHFQLMAKIPAKPELN